MQQQVGPGMPVEQPESQQLNSELEEVGAATQRSCHAATVPIARVWCHTSTTPPWLGVYRLRRLSRHSATVTPRRNWSSKDVMPDKLLPRRSIHLPFKIT